MNEIDYSLITNCKTFYRHYFGNSLKIVTLTNSKNDELLAGVGYNPSVHMDNDIFEYQLGFRHQEIYVGYFQVPDNTYAANVGDVLPCAAVYDDQSDLGWHLFYPCEYGMATKEVNFQNLSIKTIPLTILAQDMMEVYRPASDEYLRTYIDVYFNLGSTMLIMRFDGHGDDFTFHIVDQNNDIDEIANRVTLIYSKITDGSEGDALSCGVDASRCNIAVMQDDSSLLGQAFNPESFKCKGLVLSDDYNALQEEIEDIDNRLDQIEGDVQNKYVSR